MRFLADECCDAALVDALRSDGHDILYAIESLAWHNMHTRLVISGGDDD
jgi:hypothetical protein